MGLWDFGTLGLWDFGTMGLWDQTNRPTDQQTNRPTDQQTNVSGCITPTQSMKINPTGEVQSGANSLTDSPVLPSQFNESDNTIEPHHCLHKGTY